MSGPQNAPSPSGLRRADARRNRERIVAAAHLAFIRHGVSVPMEEIARAASVGVGTLYRHFSDREALLRAVVAEGIESLVALSRNETDHDSDPWETLCRTVRGCVELRIGAPLSALRPRLKDAIREIPEIARGRRALSDLLDRLVAAAQERGQMRSDVGSGDLMIMLGMLVQQECQMPQGHRWVMSRIVEIVLDGLRPGSDTLLPGEPVWAADFPKLED